MLYDALKKIDTSSHIEPVLKCGNVTSLLFITTSELFEVFGEKLAIQNYNL